MAKKIFTDESLSTFVSEVKSYTDTSVAPKKDKDLIVTYVEGSTLRVTHTSAEIYTAIQNGQTIKFQKGTELLNVLEATADYITFYMLYISMEEELQQKIVVVSGDSIMLDQDYTYEYATIAQLNAKQGKLTGTEGQVVQINSSGNAVAADLNLITVEEIDEICGGAIEYAEDVMF